MSPFSFLNRVTNTSKLNNGFTLVEVLVAMAITAFVALLGYNGLSAAIDASESQQVQSERIAKIQLPLSVLERDIRYAVNRPIKDEYGDMQSAFSGGEFNDYLLELTRADWLNPRDLPRGELQRVRYRLEDDKLWRESWSVLDRLSEEDSLQRIPLLDGINSFNLAFLEPSERGSVQTGLDGQWAERWNKSDSLPLAVELKIDIENFGEVRRVFSIVSP